MACRKPAHQHGQHTELLAGYANVATPLRACVSTVLQLLAWSLLDKGLALRAF